MEASETQYWLAVAKELFGAHQEVFAETWSAESLAMWLRDGCRCKYCGEYLIEVRQKTYGLGSIDHLLPSHEYPELKNSVTNWVLACRCCNGVKRRWDPNHEPKISDGTTPLTDDQREELLDRVKKYLDATRLLREERFKVERELILTAIQENSRAVGAAG